VPDAPVVGIPDTIFVLLVRRCGIAVVHVDGVVVRGVDKRDIHPRKEGAIAAVVRFNLVVEFGRPVR